MSNLNTILNKLGKIEEIHETNLGKHEVELAQATDVINSFTVESNDVIKRFTSEYEQAMIKVQDIIVRHNNEIAVIANNFDKQVSIYQQKIKELGVDYESTPFAKIAKAMRGSIMYKPAFFKLILDKVKSISKANYKPPY